MDLLRLDTLLIIPTSGSVSLWSLFVRSSDAALTFRLAIPRNNPGSSLS